MSKRVPSVSLAFHLREQIAIKTALQNKSEDPVARILKEYQYSSYLFITDQLSLRYRSLGCLLQLHMGLGKTFVAIAAAIKIGLPTIIVLNKAIEVNFRKEVGGFLERLKKEDSSVNIGRCTELFYYVTLNKKDSFEDLLSLAATLPGSKNSRSIIDNLDKVTIIIDEAQNLFRSIANGSANALKFYNKLMQRTTGKVILMSATPIINEPIELAICANIATASNRFPIAPAQEFEQMYLNTRMFHLGDAIEGTIQIFKELDVRDFEVSGMVKNEEILRNRLLDFILYKDVPEEGFPPQTNLQVILIPMFPDQLAKYMGAFLKETESFTPKDKKPSEHHVESSTEPNKVLSTFNSIITQAVGDMPMKSPPFLSKFEHKISSASYCVMSRQFSNSFENKSAKGKWIAEKAKMINNKIMVYSQFREYGVFVVAKELEAIGMTQFNPKGEMKQTNTFAIISGDTDDEDKNIILKTMNDPANFRGATIKVLLMTLAEGITVYDTPYVVILEALWSMGKLVQALARVRRHNSLRSLPPEERLVHIYILVSVPISMNPATFSTNPVAMQQDEIKEKKLAIRDFANETDNAINRFGGGRRRAARMRRGIDKIKTSAIAIEVADDKHLQQLCKDSIDAIILSRAMKNKRVIDSLVMILKRASLNCVELNKHLEAKKKYQCTLCEPSQLNPPLFTDSNINDINTNYNPCKLVTTPQGSDIEVDGMTYRYHPSGKSVYKYAIYALNKLSGIWTRLPEITSAAENVFKKVLQAIQKSKLKAAESIVSHA